MPYICTVFFMVLDLRLIKIGCRDDNLFFFIYIPIINCMKSPPIFLHYSRTCPTSIYRNNRSVNKLRFITCQKSNYISNIRSFPGRSGRNILH